MNNNRWGNNYGPIVNNNTATTNTNTYTTYPRSYEQPPLNPNARVVQQPNYGQPQPVVNQYGNAEPITLNNIIVDPNWHTPDIYKLEDSESLIHLAINEFYNNSRSTYPVRTQNINNNVLTDVTKNIIARFRLDSEFTQGKAVRFNINDWRMDFKMHNDQDNFSRRVYVQLVKPGDPDMLIESIDQLISKDSSRQIDNGIASNIKTSYGVCFQKITTATNLSSLQACELYANIIYNAINIIERTIFNSNAIVSNNGRYYMSYSLYDYLVNGVTSIAGINIKPIVSIDKLGGLTIAILLDFNEYISALFKGDLDYKERIEYKSGNNFNKF